MREKNNERRADAICNPLRNSLWQPDASAGPMAHRWREIKGREEVVGERADVSNESLR
jgi:hypothetical protein